MRKLLLISLILLLGLTTLLAIAGCQEESNTDIGRARFIANENRKLKTQLVQNNNELEKCLKGKTALENESKKLNALMVEQETETEKCTRERTALEKENKKLKDQLTLQDARIEGYARQLAAPEEECQSRLNSMSQAFIQIIQSLKEENAALQKQIEELEKQP